MFRFVCLLSLCVAAFGLGIGSVQPNTNKFPPSYVQTLQPIGNRILVTNPQTLPIPFPQATNNPLAYVVAVGTGLEGELNYIPNTQQRVYADYSSNQRDARVTETNFVREGDIVMLNGAGCQNLNAGASPAQLVNLNRITAIGAGLADYCLLDNIDLQVLGVVNIAQQHISGFPFLRANQAVNGGVVNEVRITGQSTIEGAAAVPQLTLALAFPATQAISVTVASIGGTADNVDIANANRHTGTLFTVNFAIGQTTVTQPVQITNDQLPEGIESFNFRIVSASGAVISQTQKVATISIVDDDTPAIVGIGPSTTQTVGEGNNLDFVLTLDRPVATAVTINYRIEGIGQSTVDRATIDNTNALNDITVPVAPLVTFNPVTGTGTIIIAANTLTNTLQTLTVVDNRVEFTEGLRVSIISATGSVRIDPNNNNADATITSADRATLSVTNTAVNVNENDPQAGFQVQLDSPVPTLFSVVLSFAGPAQQGVDFSAPASTTYPANSIAAQTITVPTLDNPAQANDHSYTVTLTGATSSLVDIAVAPNNQAVVTIVNNNP